MMKRIICSATALLAATALWAQQPAQKSVTLTLEQAIEVALDNNPTIKIAGLEIQRQDWVKKETWGNFMPNLSATAQYQYNPVLSEMRLAGMKMSMGYDNELTSNLALSMPLFAPGLYKTLKMNDEQMRAAVEASRGSKITLTADVKNAFYNILMLDESIKVLKESEANVQETVDQVTTMYKNGMSSEYDLLTAEVQLGNIKPMIVQNVNARDIAGFYLKMLLSMPEDVNVSVSGSLSDYQDQAANAPLPVAPDISGNSDLKSIEIQTEVLKKQYDLAKTARMPTLGAYGSLTVLGQSGYHGMDFMTMNKLPVDRTMRWQNPVGVGVQLSVPIFAGRTNVMKQRQIQSGIDQLKWQYKYAEDGTLSQAKSALGNLATARENLKANQKNMEAAAKAYKIAGTRYSAGAGTILELNTAQLQNTQARLTYSQSVYDFLVAQAEYDKIVGKDFE